MMHSKITWLFFFGQEPIGAKDFEISIELRLFMFSLHQPLSSTTKSNITNI